MRGMKLMAWTVGEIHGSRENRGRSGRERVVVQRGQGGVLMRRKWRVSHWTGLSMWCLSTFLGNLNILEGHKSDVRLALIKKLYNIRIDKCIEGKLLASVKVTS
ncbi:hypothetical protein Tco_1140784 [Tanacetum coccineum]